MTATEQAEARRLEMRGWTDEQWIEAYPVIERIERSGWCVAPTRDWRRRRVSRGCFAHAHNHRGDRWFGSICLQPAGGGSPSGTEMTMLHEIAHLLTPGQGHKAVWRRKMTELVEAAFGAGVYKPVRNRYSIPELAEAPEAAADAPEAGDDALAERRSAAARKAWATRRAMAAAAAA